MQHMPGLWESVVAQELIQSQFAWAGCAQARAVCRGIERGSRDWKARRRKLLLQLAPAWGERGHKAISDRLVSSWTVLLA